MSDSKPLRAISDDITLLYSSCDAYSVLARPFFSCFLKHFGVPRHVVTNMSHNFVNICERVSLTGIDPRFCDKDFSTRTIEAIKKAPTEYVLFALDDFLIEDDVDFDLFERATNLLRNNRDVGYVLLHDNRDLHAFEAENGYLRFKRKIQYRISTQLAIWKKSYLQRILRRGESAWDFEDFGSRRSNHYKEKLLFVGNIGEKAFPYHEGGILRRGKICEECVPFLKNKGFEQLLLHFGIRPAGTGISDELVQREMALTSAQKRILKLKRAACSVYCKMSLVFPWMPFPKFLSLWS